MKRIFVSIHNSLLSAAIIRSLKGQGEFSVVGTVEDADIVLMEACYGAGASPDECLKTVKSLGPECRVVMLCDENSAPEVARRVVQAKKDGLIDDFVYSSVSETYLTAMLSAL